MCADEKLAGYKLIIAIAIYLYFPCLLVVLETKKVS